ncbi:GNAT family N-acetyltransferase [Vibrio cionasavignyae]|uniref:GNAT family N-acetyltransferase n=1 Tax=Vibrio cionasavignyae TaxID=2910252 RepID=UPI003D0E10DA
MNSDALVKKIEAQLTYSTNNEGVALSDDECRRLNLCPSWLENNELSKAAFYQLTATGHKHQPSDRFPLILEQRDPRKGYNPLRPTKPTGEVYSRFDVSLDKVISFRTFDPSRDMDRFEKWMNDARVAEFWEQAWTKDKLEAFILERLSDSFTLPLIGEFNGQPFGYFEVYWVQEDRLAPYYDCQTFDRGIHLLVGENSFRGKAHFDSWLWALCHYIFLDDVRTTRIVMEPRVDNAKLFHRLTTTCFEKCFEFNFPHKRSALMMMLRDRFFTEARNG